MRTRQEEHESLTDYQGFADAQAQIGQFIDDVYQPRRIHSLFGYLTRARFESQRKSIYAIRDAQNLFGKVIGVPTEPL